MMGHLQFVQINETGKTAVVKFIDIEKEKDFGNPFVGRRELRTRYIQWAGDQVEKYFFLRIMRISTNDDTIVWLYSKDFKCYWFVQQYNSILHYVKNE